MSRTYLTFGDIEGKLDVLRIECTRCQRKGRYGVAKLILSNIGSANKPLTANARTIAALVMSNSVQNIGQPP